METNKSYFLFIVPELDKDPEQPTFRVVNFSGQEALSQPYAFRINLMAKKENISGLLFKEAKFTITIGAQTSSYYGIISHFDQLRKIDDNCYYQARLMPKWHLLSLYRMSDVYLNQSLPDIIKAVFSQAGFTENDYRLDLKGSYTPPADSAGPYNRWSYVCQYEETCLNFLSRLMEREGLYYYFEQGEGRGRMVITDDKIAHKKSEHKLFFKAPGTPSTGADDTLVQEIVSHQCILPKKVILKNYNYERASQDVMSVEAFVSNDGQEDKNLIGNVNIFGENFSSSEEGTALARIRAQEILCTGGTYTGFGTAVPLVTGELKHLTHDSEVFTGWYLVTAVNHKGAQSLAGNAGLEEKSDSFSYSNDFTFIRDSVQFRPPRVTALPKIRGTMTAFIDSEGSGDFADLDKWGRYKVRLPFTLSAKDGGKASTRIRMATPYTGVGLNGYGMHLPIHKGAEVILAFRDGDPDQPVIAGAVYNSQNANVVTDNNFKQHVIKTPGGNKIVMDDTPGQESMYLFSPVGKKGNWLYLGHGGTGEGAFKGEKGDKGDAGAKGDKGDKGESGAEAKSVMHFKSSGNKHEVIIGQEDSFVIGSENYVTLGSKMEAMLGTASEFTAAMKTIIEIADTLEYKKGRHLEFGKTTERIKDDDELVGIDRVSLGAGVTELEKRALESVRTGAFMIAAALGALIAAAAGDIGGAANPEGEGDSGHVVGQVMGMSIPLIVGTGAQMAAMKMLVNRLKTSLVNPIANIGLSDAGVVIGATSMDSHGQTNNGIIMSVGAPKPPGIGALPPPDLTLKMTPGAAESITLEKREGGKVTVNGDGVSIEKPHDGAAADTSIALTAANILIQRNNGGRVKISDNGVGLSQNNGGRMGVLADRAEMLSPDQSSQIRVSNQGINVNFTQAQQLKAGLLQVDGDNFIKLG